MAKKKDHTLGPEALDRTIERLGEMIGSKQFDVAGHGGALGVSLLELEAAFLELRERRIMAAQHTARGLAGIGVGTLQ